MLICKKIFKVLSFTKNRESKWEYFTTDYDDLLLLPIDYFQIIP